MARVHGVDVFAPLTGAIPSDGEHRVACRFIYTDYNEESVCVRLAYFLGASDLYKGCR